MRRYENERADNLRASWTTRTLASYIAAGYMTDGKTENVALTNAEKITLDAVEAALLGARQEQPKENAAGSYERFMSKLGMSGGQRPV